MGQTNLSVMELAAHFNGTCPQPFPRRLLVEELGTIAKEDLERSEVAQQVLVPLLSSTSKLDRFCAYRLLSDLKRTGYSTEDTDNNLRIFEADDDNEEIWS